MNWIEYFRNLANNVKLKSKDSKTQIGAIIVGNDNEIVSTGYNSFPRGIDDTNELRQERPEKYFWFEHAERNAIYNAARIGVSTKGTTMYLSHWFPCADCARGIINAGITTIYCDKIDTEDKSTSYLESFKRSKEMLLEADVKICFYDEIKN
jgi:dCMP deaminase